MDMFEFGLEIVFILENEWCKKIDDPRKGSKNETPLEPYPRKLKIPYTKHLMQKKSNIHVFIIHFVKFDQIIKIPNIFTNCVDRMTPYHGYNVCNMSR